MSQHDAEEEAVRRLGAPASLARGYSRFDAPFRALLACCAASTTLIAVWLVFVLTSVMPLRDPSHIPLWSAITFGFVVFAGATLAVVVLGPRPALVGVLAILSLGALAFGGVAVRAMYVAASTGAHFEGYQLLMGLAIGGHGACALAYAAASRRAAASPTASRPGL